MVKASANTNLNFLNPLNHLGFGLGPAIKGLGCGIGFRLIMNYKTYMHCIGYSVLISPDEYEVIGF